MKIHYLKINPLYLERIEAGTKTFEIRKNDRDFQVGDKLVFTPYDSATNTYHPQPHEYIADVTYISTYEQKADYVVMAIKLNAPREAPNGTMG